MQKKFSLSSKIVLTLLLILCIFLALIRYQQYSGQKSIDEEQQNLKQQIDSLSKKNQDLSNSLSYLGSPDFKEQTARQQLNLKRNGEIVFGFEDAPNASSTENGQDNAGEPNYQKWITYFFGN